MKMQIKLPDIKITFFLASIIFLIIACSNNSSNKSGQNAYDTTYTVKLVYPIPTPLEISNMLNNAGASYILSISNKPENVDRYFTEEARALNLGVYGADISYSATYNKSQQTMNFLGCTKKLRDGLEIQTTCHVDLVNRMERNIDNEDSVYFILTCAYKNTFDYLNENNKGATSVLILAGGWIEGLYISTELAELTHKYQEIYQGIADQKETLNKLIPLMETYKDNERVNEICSKLKGIKTIFDELLVVEGKSQLSKASFVKLKKEIDPLRKNVVETQ